MRSIPLACVLILTVPAPAQQCASGPPAGLGTVQVLSQTCNAGSLPRTTCKLLRVQCEGIPDIQVAVRISEPEPSLTVRGTVVAGTGGGGVGHYADRSAGGLAVIRALLARGFRVVDRSWRSSWFGSQSVKKQSCRYATLITWVHQNVHTGGAFCVTGNSGGSAEIGYALSAWGRGAIIDVAVPTGGPPMARLDYLCLNPAEWQKLCPTVVPDHRSECRTVACTIGSHQVCRSCTSNATAADLHADSILHPGAALRYPRTRVHMVIGGRDCGSAVPNAMLFFRAIGSEKVLEFAKGAPHWVPGNQAGQDAIVRAILGGAACRPGTLAARAWPAVGGRLDLDVFGPPGNAYVVLLGGPPRPIEIPGLGWLFIGAPILPLGAGRLDATTGLATFSLPVPNEPALAGVEAFDQALAGPCLTNLVRFQVLRP